jgi:hypothetical protein
VRSPVIAFLFGSMPELIEPRVKRGLRLKLALVLFCPLQPLELGEGSLTLRLGSLEQQDLAALRPSS